MKIIFETVTKYNNRIKELDSLINDLKEYCEEHPEDIVDHKNHEILEYIREELKKERKELKIKELRKRYKLEGVLE